jgi:HlyD family secretion protein
MRKWLVRLAFAAAILAVVIVVKLTLLAPDEVPVQVEEVGKGRVESTVTNSRAGTVKARRRARLSPEIGGQVIAIPFREGETVVAGDVLLRLDDRTQRSRLKLARRDLEAAEAESERACLAAARAARELERVERLAAEAIVSADLLDQVDSSRLVADAACKSAQALVARARAAAESAATEVQKTVLQAPFGGVVAEISIEVGEWTTPSPPALPVPAVIDILDPRSIYISAPMDEVDSAAIRAAQLARISVDSHRGQTFSGRVTRVAPYVLDIQEQNRTVEIEVEFDDQEFASTLLPGTSADVEIILEVREDVLRIPTGALMEGARVLVLEDGVLAERGLEIGLRNWNYCQVLDGLQEGERLVTSLDRSEVEAGARALAVDSLDEVD